MNKDRLREEIERDEGRVNEVYKCTMGVSTFGVGHAIKKTDPEWGSVIDTKIEESRLDQDFEEEIEMHYNAHNDLGDAIYYLDYSAETDNHTSLANVVRLLELDCDKVNNSTYILIKDAIFEMSSLERRWFIRYWLRTPRNGINAGLCLKIVAKFFDVNLSQIKKYANFNSLHSIVIECNSFYEFESWFFRNSYVSKGSSYEKVVC